MSKAREPTAKRGPGPGGLERWELSAGQSTAEVVPGRGGLVTRFTVAGEPVLYLDEETLSDRSKNVRGGIPVLFPIAGRLSGDRYILKEGAAERAYPMRQHGLARQAPWSVHQVAGARLTMELRSSPASKVNYPFDFAYRLSVDLGRAGGRSLALEQEIENLGSRPLPLHLGFHPYFAVPEERKDEVRVETGATRAFDNVRGEVVPFGGVSFSEGEVDLHLLDHRHPGTTLLVPGRPARILEWSESYRTMVLWTQAHKGFVCVEPWTAPGDALNTGEGLIEVPPGERWTGHFVISVDSSY